MESMKESLCSSCKHHTQKKSIDDVPSECYSCVWEQSRTGHFINYEPDIGRLLKNKLEQPPVTEEEEEEWMRKEIKMTVKKDNVNSPSHYVIRPGLEVMDVRDAILEKMEGVINLKQADKWSRSWEYMTRAFLKNGLEDLEKAQYYLKELIEETKKKCT